MLTLGIGIVIGLVIAVLLFGWWASNMFKY